MNHLLFRNKCLDEDVVNDLRSQFGISQNMALRIVQYFRKKFSLPQQSYLKRRVVEKNRQFSDLFEVEETANSPTVLCNNSQAFIDRIVTARNLTNSRVAVKLGWTLDKEV